MTIHIDDDLHLEFRRRAAKEGQSLTEFVNRVLRAGLASLRDEERSRSRRFRQRSYSMGTPRCDMTKALSLAAELEDEAILENYDAQTDEEAAQKDEAAMRQYDACFRTQRRTS